jgi:DNA-binding transcriptional regulator YiaG
VAHSNRSKNNPIAGREPKCEEVRDAREKAGLTQEEAAAVIYTSPRNWANWEQGREARSMPAASWELFLLKTGQFRWLSKQLVELTSGATVAFRS